MKKSLAAKTLGLKPIYDEVEGGKEAFRPKSAPGIFLSATQKAQAAEAKLEKYKDSLPVRPIDPNLVISLYLQTGLRAHLRVRTSRA